MAGKESPSAEDVSGLLKKVDIEADAAQVAALIKAMEGKKLDEVIAEGEKKLVTVGGSGGGGGAAAPAAAAGEAKEDKGKKDDKPKVRSVQLLSRNSLANGAEGGEEGGSGRD